MCDRHDGFPQATKYSEESETAACLEIETKLTIKKFVEQLFMSMAVQRGFPGLNHCIYCRIVLARIVVLAT
jgi:hypothetical protein